jgi:hypothetical protein
MESIKVGMGLPQTKQVVFKAPWVPVEEKAKN